MQAAESTRTAAEGSGVAMVDMRAREEIASLYSQIEEGHGVREMYEAQLTELQAQQVHLG